MSYVLAIDVGTSFTAAALARPHQGPLSPPEILPLGLHGSAVPSVLYYADDGRVLVGEPAERRGLDDPHRMVREFKRRIGDSVPLSVGDNWLAPEDVYASMARWVVDRAEEREGSSPSSIVMTYPAAWGAHRTSVVQAALNVAGLEAVTLLSEPEAAALHYASQTRVEDGSVIAVYDLGGGTFDTAILRKVGAGNFELLGRPDGIETLGGADFDAAVLRHVMGHLGNAGEGLDPASPETLAALSRLRRECREAKEALSMDSEASVAVALPGTQRSVRLVRSEFEAMVDQPLRETVDALERSLRSNRLEPQDLSAVLLIGGSSRIPLVAELISVELGRPIAVDADPKSSICRGAALAGLSQVADAVAADAPAATPTEPEATRPRVVARVPVAGVVKAARGRPGRHAPRPRVRMAAAAATAATALAIATATAAQSPDGNGLLASMFGAQAADVMRDVGAQDSGTRDGASGGGPAAAAPLTGAPATGLEASARTGAGPAGAGAGAGRSPVQRATGTGRGSVANGPAGTGSGTSAGAQGQAGAAAGGTTGTTPGSGTTPGTGTPPGSGTPSTPTEPGGAASGPTPPPATNPGTPPPATGPGTPPPATDPGTPASPTGPGTPPPATDPGATPPPATDPVTPPPAPDPAPPSPEPTAPLGDPAPTQDPAPVTAPVTDPPPATTDNGPSLDTASTSVA
ncbi:Hsp70 family protein [Arthrobacter sp. fls2-241-R2A-172]|uniref:Hsp70 family protein n=1 Tax=Arthrobacter sp. fls2-241-R2A-172 TaxID=3040325 RepID=UPI00255133DC|nr:Hsp70 family protein [Arthrobacter sp. fls2-241-R2A-172]